MAVLACVGAPGGIASAQDAVKKPPAAKAENKAPPAKGARPKADPAAKAVPAKPTPTPTPAPAPAPPAAPTTADVDEEVKEAGAKAEPAGLPLPRFVSLRTNPINMRTGPGVRYPVDWVYQRRHLPVEVVAEFDTWRRIRDPGGSEGWVHQSMLTGRRTGMVKGGTQALRRTNADTAEQVASLEQGVIVNVQRCPAGPFCRVEVNGLQGWLKRDQLWGVYPDETVE